MLLPLALAGCVQDTASYVIDGNREHAIVLIRSQNWFWEDSVRLAIAPAQMPECQGSLIVEDVPRNASLALYQGPDEYAEPIYILKTGERHFAISTSSCRVQEFKAPPPELGTALGVFQEREGVFGFAAGQS